MGLSYLFFGTPDTCRPVLDELLRAGRPPATVVCQPDRPSGRGCRLAAPAAKQWANDHGIDTLQPERCRDPAFLDQVGAAAPDLGLVFAFGQLLPEQLLSIPRLGFINIHPSLLPRYRGAAPIQWALINGDQTTGVTILQVTPRLDDGDILLQREVGIAPDENAVELGERLARLGGRLAIEALDLLESGQDAWTPQDEQQVIWAPALKKEDGRIDWERPAVAVHDRIRGVQPWPGAHTRLRGKVFKIHRARPGPAGLAGAGPGRVLRAAGDELLVGTADGTLRLLEVQLEGKKRMPARAFLAGRGVEVGDVLG